MGCRQSSPVDAPASSSRVNALAPPSPASAPVSNPSNTFPSAPVSAAAPDSAPRSNAFNAAPSAPASETAPKSAPAPEPEPTETKPAGRFAINGYSIFESGIVYYTIELAEESAGAAVQKRFREFKALHQALAKKEDGAALPALPDSGVRSVLKGRHNAELIKAREVQLAAVLNAIADRPALADSSEFRQFVAPASA